MKLRQEVVKKYALYMALDTYCTEWPAEEPYRALSDMLVLHVVPDGVIVCQDYEDWPTEKLATAIQDSSNYFERLMYVCFEKALQTE